MNEIVPIQNLIYTIRGQKVMLDSDLAQLYEVETRVLNQAVKRNIDRFPAHFMFQLTKEEFDFLISQFVISKNTDETRGGRQKLPYVFTEQGVAMLSSVLRSKKAIQTNIHIMDAFVTMRNYAVAQISQNKEIEEVKKMLLLYMENTDNKISKQQREINTIIQALNNLIETPKETKQIGFKVDK